MSSNSFHTYTNDVLGTLDGIAIAQAIRKGDFTAEEAALAAVNRSKLADEKLNAVAEESYGLAIADAKHSHSGGVFAGVPSFIKDNEDVAGMTTRHGSKGTPTKPAKKASRFVEQYNSLGFSILGKSSMPEFGLTATTEAEHTGPTRNPWELNHTTGGSSGGTAALVAAGAVPLAHGNDGGGSIRIPAACCGLVGLKPSRDRLKNAVGVEYLPVNIVHQGVLSRTVRDTAAFFAGAEEFYYNKKLPKLGMVEGPNKDRLRIGFLSHSPEGNTIDPEVADCVKATAKQLEGLGHNVFEIDYPFDPRGGEYFLLYWSMLAFIIKQAGPLLFGFDFKRSELDDFTHGLTDHFKSSLPKVPQAIAGLANFHKDYAKAFDKMDIMLTPVTATEPPVIGHLSSSQDFAAKFDKLQNFVPFTPAQNVSGAPGISLPMGLTKAGLPIGLQFVSTLGDEKRLLQLAYEVEAAFPFKRIDQL